MKTKVYKIYDNLRGNYVTFQDVRGMWNVIYDEIEVEIPDGYELAETTAEEKAIYDTDGNHYGICLTERERIMAVTIDKKTQKAKRIELKRI